ncbi:serine/threonine-protein phosphatase 2A regulatory subunit B'' subunit alpha isoform X1 [Prionailurus iriomotensis]
MAATYRLVVSTVNHYSSVVIDRRFEQAIHYCTGTCHTFTHGVDCIVVHHSVCADLLHIPVSQFKDADLNSMFLPHENGFSSAEGDYHQQALTGIPRVKKGSTFQNTCNLKDIAGEAISFASGKIKEFSFEKLKNSNHAAYKKGRKVKSDSFNRRSVDFDLLCGHYNNDGNSPSFGLLQSSSVEEKSLSHRNSLDANLTSVLLHNFSEEDLVTQILEKHKIDNFSSGTDIKMCLDILLKCSEDLKKCTDIIKQCIKKKSGSSINEGNGNDAISSSETVYMNVMTRLASYLKKLPFEFMQPGNNDAIDLTELVSNMPSLQLTPFSPVFGTEQPPKYEDVVQLSAPDSGQFQTIELQDDKHSSRKTDAVSSIPNNSTNPLYNSEVNDPRTLKDTQLQSQSLTMNPLENVSSNDLMETLYIEEESDGKKASDKGQRAENGPGQLLNEDKAAFSNRVTHLKKCPASVQNESGKIFEKPVVNLPEEDFKSKVPKVEEGGHRDFMNLNSQEEIDKLLMDLESFSQKMETSLREPLAKGKNSNSLSSPSPLTSQLPIDLEPKSKVSAATEKVSPSCLTRIIETNGHKIEEEDRVLLLRILESIEDFAQELVECKSGRGSLSQEKEMMQILQETLTTSSQANLSVCRSPVGDKAKESTSVVLIQQTPEVIKIQNKPEKKPGTPLPPTATFPSSPRPLSPVPHVNNVVNAPLSINIPRFYFPEGLPDACSNHEQTLSKIETAFMDIEDQKADIYEMGKIAKTLWLSSLLESPHVPGCRGREDRICVRTVIRCHVEKELLNNHHDDASKFICLLAKPSCNSLEQEDFIPLLQDVVDTHPGLTFLKDAPEFHSRYITTVIQRIFYTVNRSWSGKITSTEIRKSNFLQTLALLEEEEDINQITDYFSYEHFYVIYCKFWELDSDHDLYISQADLSRYNDQASSNRIIERIFSGAVTRGKTVQKEGRMSYADFVWFLISEEDKRNPTSIEYWFRCMDMDGDGVLSMYELEYFYEEQCERMEAMGIEPLPFHDLLCQMLDLVKPASDGKITLRDLKRCRMAHIFYDTFFNLEKYLDHEQRDPFAVQKDVENEGPEPSDWDRFAAEEYETLVAEESAQAQFQEGSFEDYETEEPVSPSEIGNKGNKSQIVTSSLSEKCGKLQSVDEE